MLTAALALSLIAVLAGGATFALLGGKDDASVDGAPVLPPVVGPIALTGDPKAADPCALTDRTVLRRFGQPLIMNSPDLEQCTARITTTSGTEFDLEVIFATRAESVPELGGKSQKLGDLIIVSDGIEPENPYNRRNRLVLADLTQIFLEVDVSAPDPCAVTEVATATAVNRLAREGISYRPDRTSGWLIAGSDACKVLQPALSRVPELDSNDRFPGFANWSCLWDSGEKGSPRVFIQFIVDVGRVPRTPPPPR